jgi:perosamine synthetase
LSESFIPWGKPVLWGNEQEFVLKALESTWISGGPYVEELERRLAGLCGVPHAVAVTSGTSALHLAYLALGLRPGDELVVPGFGFQAAANMALHMHARPVFAEVDPQTWCVTAATVEPCLSPRTRAVVVLHTYGNVCPMDEICDLAGRRGIPVIEDVAEALGSCYRGRQAGSFGTFSCFSFQATKTITTGEGGLVLTPDRGLYERMVLYRSHGMLKRRYWHEVPGHNFRLTNIQAALGCAQLEHFDTILEERDRIHRRYLACLHGQPGVTLQHFPPPVRPALWAMACRLGAEAFPQGRDAVLAGLRQAGIETRPGFYPPSYQPIYDAPALPVSERVSDEMLCLPTYPTLGDETIAHICRQLLALRGAAGSPRAAV